MATTNRPYHSAPALHPPQPEHSHHHQLDLTNTAMEDFRQLFEMFDTNKNGTIDSTEFNHILKMLGDGCPQRKSLDGMLRVACKTPSNRPVPTTLTFDQFMAFFAIYKQDWPAHVSHQDVFNVLDDDSSGTISPEELAKVLGRFGMRITDDEANAMADYATPFPGPNQIIMADVTAVAERVQAFRQSLQNNADTSDTSEDENRLHALG